MLRARHRGHRSESTVDHRHSACAVRAARDRSRKSASATRAFIGGIGMARAIWHCSISFGLVEMNAKELSLAQKLVVEMTEKWNPSKFEDQYARDVQKVVGATVESGDIHAMPEQKTERPRRGGGKIIDLMPLLEQSIEGTRRSEARDRSPARSVKKHSARSKPARVRHSA
jgi:non-homologous end joining protein Ku